MHHINDAIKDAWGEEYRLVTCDGIELDDSATTQGKQTACRLCMLSLINILLDFWKAPRRKLYSIKVKESARGKRHSSDEDDDFLRKAL